MTRTTNARLAGFTFLFYIVAGITSMVLSGRASGGEGIAGRLAAIALHAPAVRVNVLLTLLQAFSAIVLGVTLYAITRDQDRDLAMLGLVCRVVEGITGLFVARTLGLLWLATTDLPKEEIAASHVLAGFLLRMGAWHPGASFFAAGSALFSWLLLRGRMIPVTLAWLGVFASILLVVILPLQLAGLASGVITSFAFTWLPMLVFEVVLALWLIVKGAAVPARTQPYPA
jgi:Domain of unknown function (DUF4386)